MNGWRTIRDLTRAEHERFQAALRRPARAQRDQLREILTLHADSDFGRRHGFSSIRDADDFRARIPIREPDAFAAEIRRMADGEPGRLCATPVVTFEQTSGSQSGGRLVPYTDAGLAGFRRAIHPWLHDLLSHRPGIADGHAYWSVSPVARPRVGSATRLGVSSDAEYFGDDIAELVGGLSAAPMALASLEDVAAWRYLLLRCLLSARDLSLVSVWSPTFLTGLLDALTADAEDLVADIADGTVSHRGAAGLAALGRLRPDRQRAGEIEAILSGQPEDLGALWPALDTVSCWTHGSAARFVDEVGRRLPGAWIQPKGLLATEAAVSIPLAQSPWPVIAINSGFFEFLDEHDESFLSHQLLTGETYRVVITTHSGLYRYDLGDRVRVHERMAGTPTIEFVGRGRLVSDLCGEKLSEAFVQSAIGDEPGFAMLAPLEDGSGYAIFLDSERCGEAAAAARAGRIERRLCDNPQYAYARRLDQLAPLRAIRTQEPLERYYAACMDRGQRIGEIKPAALRTESCWEAILAGGASTNTIDDPAGIETVEASA